MGWLPLLSFPVMAGGVPAIRPLTVRAQMAGTRPAMTGEAHGAYPDANGDAPGHDGDEKTGSTKPIAAANYPDAFGAKPGDDGWARDFG
jgi:hypothetical protein